MSFVQWKLHIERSTDLFRPKDTTKLFVAIKKPHKPVASCTIARWLKETLGLAGIDVSIFSGHSVRGDDSVSAAAGAGVTMSDSCRQLIGVPSQCSEGSTTGPLMIIHYGRSVLSSLASGET